MVLDHLFCFSTATVLLGMDSYELFFVSGPTGTREQIFVRAIVYMFGNWLSFSTRVGFFFLNRRHV
jgi:hypothetical protein